MADTSYGYLYINHDDTDPEAQEARLGSAIIYRDYGNGFTPQRPALSKLIATVSEGDFVSVDRLDQIADSVSDLYDLLSAFAARGVAFEATADQFLMRDRLNAVEEPRDIALIGEMARLERKTHASLQPFPGTPFAGEGSRGLPEPALSITQVLDAEQQHLAGVPLRLLSQTLRVTPAQLFKAIRRDFEYAEYPSLT